MHENSRSDVYAAAGVDIRTGSIVGDAYDQRIDPYRCIRIPVFRSPALPSQAGQDSFVLPKNAPGHNLLLMSNVTSQYGKATVS